MNRVNNYHSDQPGTILYMTGYCSYLKPNILLKLLLSGNTFLFLNLLVTPICFWISCYDCFRFSVFYETRLLYL